jgi:hypothetical protein
MMRHLETAIDNDTATPKLLAVMQKRLDAIDEQYQGDPGVAHQYHKLLEIQALIYGTQRREAEATKFMNGAIEMAGGADKLSSRLLRTYIHQHQQGGAASHPAAQAATPSTAAKSQQAEGMQLFGMSLARLALLSIFTAGLYNLYWFYRNWKFVKQYDGSRIWPFWRAVFTIIWMWPLLYKIRHSARRQGYDHSYSPVVVGTMFVLLTMGAKAVTYISGHRLVLGAASLALLALSVWPLLVVQQAINFNNSRLPRKKIKRTAPEIILIIVGVVLFVVYAVTLFVPLKKIQNKVYPNERHVAVQQQQARLESLTAQYNTCASELKTRAKTIDKNDPDAVDEYNADVANCDSVRQQQNEAVDAYNSLIARRAN